MSLERKPDKTIKKGEIGRKKKIQTTEGTAGSELVGKIAETSISLGEVVQRLKKEHDINVTIPTVTTYLQMHWGKGYGDKKKEMSLRRSKVKRWKTEYGLARQGIADQFYEDYISTDDGVFYDWGTMDDIFSKNDLVSLPRVEDRAYKGKDIINYSKDGKFGWKIDPSDPDALGTVNHSVLSIMTLQLRKRIEGLVEEKKRKLIQDEARKRLEDFAYENRETLTSDDIPKVMRDITKEVRGELKPELAVMEGEVEDRLLEVLAKLSKGDARTRILHDKEIYNKKLDPAYASSDKKWRGRQRMVSMPERIFSRSVYNLPFLLWMHPKRVQVHCASEDTEILTKDGWKFFYELGKNDEVATLDSDDVLEYQKPTEIIKANYEGPMVHFSKANIDLLVTPNHKMWTARRSVFTSVSNPTYEHRWDFVTAQEMLEKSTKKYPWIIKRDSKYNYGKNLEFYSLVDGDYHTNVESVDIPSKLWLTFVGLMIGDGHLGINKRNYRLTLAADVKDKFRDFKIDISQQICDLLGQSMYVNDSVIEISSKRLYELLLPIGKSNKKTIPREYLDLNVDLLFYLYDGLIKSDEHYTEYTSHRYTTISPLLRDTFQELCLKLGYVGTYTVSPESEMEDPRTGKIYIRKEAYRFSIATSRPNVQIFDKDISVVDYSGNVYCVTVPNHRIFVRRNGKVCWTGNSHNLSKKLPELLNPEEPKVKAEFNEIPGINGNVRFPKNVEEHVKTQEAGMIVTEDFAKKFRYFTVVEEGTLIADSKGGFPTAPRIHKSIKNYKDYKKETDIIEGTYPVDRLDPLTLGGFGELGVGVGNKFAKHSGELFLVGDSKERKRKITLAQGESGDDTRELSYHSQDYQIVREDVLKVADKLLDRGGLKGIISDIVPSLGANPKTGKPYDVVCNYEEVWREADRSTAAGRLDDDRFFKQGKKKSAIVREHEEGKGEIFFFMIDKFAQDSTTTGLSFSPTLVSGLWEWALDGLEINTEEARNNLIDSFSNDYFRGRGNLVPTLKALHYKAVKKDGIVSLEIDDGEPTADEHGEIIELPHTYAGNTYQRAYVPHSVARVYFDGTTFREVYISQMDKTPNDASDFYWFNIMKQAKNRFGLFPKMDWGIQLVTRPWAEDPKDPTKYHKVQMDYLDVIDMGGDPYDPNLIVTFRKEPVTGKESIQTHPVEVDFTAKVRGSIGLNPTVALTATIDYDGDTVVAFVPAIKDAVVKLPKEDMDTLNEWKTRKFDETFEALYKQARNLPYAKDEAELGVMCAAYNQQIAETESELIERLGGLRKRAMILQGKQAPPVVTIGEGTKYEETHIMDIALINQISDVEKVLKMKEPRWKVKKLEKKPIEGLSKDEWDLVRDSYLRKELTKLVNNVIKDKGVKKLYDLLREPSDYMKKEFVTKSGYEGDPIGLKIDTKSRLLDRILYNELRESDIFSDLDKR